MTEKNNEVSEIRMSEETKRDVDAKANMFAIVAIVIFAALLCAAIAITQ